MKEVRKKSADPAVNKMLVKAWRQQTELAWDRADALQPKCGFGRLAVCCTDCHEGPCRVNPFAADASKTVCGRSQDDLTAGHFLKLAAAGTTALLDLAARFGSHLDNSVVTAALLPGDDLLATAQYGQRLAAQGRAAVQALAAIAEVKAAVSEPSQPVVTTANLGALRADAANIVLHGHIPPAAVRLIAAAAAGRAGVTAMCGAETPGLPVLTNYDSQETPLLTDAVDLLVIGSQCVMPATVALASDKKTPVLAAAAITGEQAAADAVAAALAHFAARAGKPVDIPAESGELHAGFTADNSAPLFAALTKAHAQGALRGLVYFGGCGNLAATQDAGLIKLAGSLISEGYLIATAGCAGAALAKAGLCRPTAAPDRLRAVLPAGTPPVLHLGACHDAGQFLRLAAAVGDRLPVFAVLPEITHNKILATAVAFAAQGITAYIGLDDAAAIPAASLAGGLFPLGEFSLQHPAAAQVAATK